MNSKINDLAEKWTKDQLIIFLWDLLDDIDTANDVSKSSDVFFRTMVNDIQSKRWDSGIHCDGYNLFYGGKKIGL